MSPFQRRLIKRRTALMKRGNPLFKNAIKTQYKDALKIISYNPVEHIQEQLKLIKSEPILKAFEHYYASAASIGMMWREELIKDSPLIYKQVFENSLKNYATSKAGSRIKEISNTTKELIQNAVKDATEQAFADGLGVEKVKDLIIQGVKDQFGEIAQTRARLISQTEMITASNQAAMEAAKSTNREFKKYWSTSGLATVRPSHMECEQYSMDQGGLDEGELFPNGLEFPGDPNGGADEICNCHCTLLVELV